ncbi:MAG: YciI family protein [Deltaproteobacteria bacterium]|nr:YciI family protein [Deltaproteobacteria bacterium]
MQYLALIYDTEANRQNMTPEDTKQLLADYGAFTEAAKEAGVFVGGEALTPVHTATTVRLRDGKVLTTDGPFAETKEQLGGYYLLDCKDLDDALAWAAKIPTAKQGSIEVRPIMVW